MAEKHGGGPIYHNQLLLDYSNFIFRFKHIVYIVSEIAGRMINISYIMDPLLSQPQGYTKPIPLILFLLFSFSESVCHWKEVKIMGTFVQNTITLIRAPNNTGY